MAKKSGVYSSLSDDVLAGYSKNGDDNAFNELVIRYLKSRGLDASFVRMQNI